MVRGPEDGGIFINLLKDESSSVLPDDQVSIEVHLHAEVDDDDYCRRARDNANRQRANIVKIVKEKDKDSLQSFGGVRGIAEALCTDLELGILGDEESLEFRNARESAEAAQISSTQAAREAPIRIKQEGRKTGWYEGAIITVVIFIFILAPIFCNLIRKRPQRLLEMQKPIDTVVVIRDGCQKELLISNVVVGDVVCLTSGSPIPGDGLVIVNPGDDHSLLVVDHDGLESTVDEKTPFLFYGAKVINGNGQMLITSVGLDTVLGELMNQVSNTCNETPLPAQLEKVGTTTQIAGISISILTLVVLFLRFMLEGKHTTNQHSADLPELKNTAATKGIIDIIKKVATKPDGKICRFTTLLAILLVGIQEPIPFVILLATAYMRKRMFSGKAYAEDLLAYVTVGSANIICAEKLYQPEVVKCYVGGENIQKGCWADSGVGTCVVEVLCQCISTPILMALVHGRSTEDPLLPWAASELGMDMEISRQNSTVQEMKALSSNEEGSTENMEDTISEYAGKALQRRY
nr:calcium-transporting ATPase 12, plasma membrane-type-like [Ziziphus jujuba var. spinosa]